MSTEPNFQQVCETLRERGKELQSLDPLVSTIYHQMWNASSWDSSYLWDQLSRYDKDNMCYEFRRGLCEDDAARCDVCGSRIASGLCNGCILAEDKPRQGDAVAAALHFASENAELMALLEDLRTKLQTTEQERAEQWRISRELEAKLLVSSAALSEFREKAQKAEQKGTK